MWPLPREIANIWSIGILIFFIIGVIICIVFIYIRRKLEKSRRGRIFKDIFLISVGIILIGLVLWVITLFPFLMYVSLTLFMMFLFPILFIIKGVASLVRELLSHRGQVLKNNVKLEYEQKPQVPINMLPSVKGTVSKVKFCQRCGNPISDEKIQFCSNCGAKIE
jgi:dolichyl-phosphate-mannose--protein O-mannosyl transferase